LVQKFDAITVVLGEKPQCILWNGTQQTICPILQNANLVKDFIDKGLSFNNLQTLKNQIIIEEQEQANLHEQLNQLVFCLYFGGTPADLAANQWYEYVQNAEK
jgi:hypothetical protein